jgi:hypothetical protein
MVWHHATAKSKEQAASGYARQKLLRQRRKAAAALAPGPVPLRALPWYQSLQNIPLYVYPDCTFPANQSPAHQYPVLPPHDRVGHVFGLRLKPTYFAGNALRSACPPTMAPFNAMQPLKHLYNRLRFLGRSIALVVSSSVQLSVRDLLKRRESYRGAKVGCFWVGEAAF